MMIVNDSKSTSFSSSLGVLKTNKKTYWLLGGINKVGDKFNLSKKYCKDINAFIYGKNKKFFINKLKGKIECYDFKDINDALKKIFSIIKKHKTISKTVLFSPCAASFDSFRNFEDRGLYFNKLVKNDFDGK